MTDQRHLTTERLRLDIPTADDLDEMHAIHSDPRVWTHFPTLRHTEPERTRSMLDVWMAASSTTRPRVGSRRNSA